MATLRRKQPASLPSEETDSPPARKSLKFHRHAVLYALLLPMLALLLQLLLVIVAETTSPSNDVDIDIDTSTTIATSTSLVTSQTTIVSAYFQIKSKYAKETYLEWMENFLSLQDPMVIFTTSDWVQPIMSKRQHAVNKTFLVVMKLSEVPLATNHDAAFWEHQLEIDPERKRHAGYMVFWVWLSKTYFVKRAIETNPFQSEVFLWSDIGCFRGKSAYANKLLFKHPEVIPRHGVLFLSHKADPAPPPVLWWTSKLTEPQHFYHSGSQMAGYADSFLLFHAAFVDTLSGFLQRKLFIGDDQTVLQCTCTQHPNLCAYITRNQVKDNHYFGLRYALHHGGHYDLWRPGTTNNDTMKI
jgi:hypothetical protein